MRVIVQCAGCETPANVQKSVRSALRAAGAELRIGPGDLVVRFVSPQAIRELKRRWMGVDGCTDVLSFPSGIRDPEGRRQWGDVAVCLEIARRQAQRRRRSVEREAAELALHGLLHVVGYDHETDGGEMAALERRLRRLLAPKRA